MRERKGILIVKGVMATSIGGGAVEVVVVVNALETRITSSSLEIGRINGIHFFPFR